MVYRYYNIELKFENSNLLNVSYDVDYNVYEDDVEISEYGYDYKEVLTISKVGTTTVINPYERTVTVTTTDGGTIDGYGDYLQITINGDGTIKDWDKLKKKLLNYVENYLDFDKVKSNVNVEDYIS